MRVIFHRKSRWAWAVCLLLLSGFIANSISNYLVERASVRKIITDSTLPLSSDNVYSEIQRDLLSPVLIASMMASNTFLQDWVNEGEKDQSQMVDYLKAIKTRYGTVSSFFVSEKTRNYYYADGLLKTVREDEPRDEWYFRVREMKSLYEINVDPDLANRDETTIFINYRVIDDQGNYLGATGVGLTVNWVNQLISRYESKYARQIYFADASGKIVLRPSNSQMMKYANLQDIDGLESQVARMLDGSTQSLTYDRAGERRILNCRFVPELKWYLIVEQSEEMMLAPLRKKLRTNIFIAIAMTALVGFICIVVIRSHKAGIEARNRELTENARVILQQKADLKLKAEELECANERLMAVNHEKDEFLSIAAHDLRNPLCAIVTVTEMIGRDLPPNAESREMLAMIQDSCKSMLELIEEVLNVAKIESFHGEIEREPVEWNDLLEAGLSQHRSHAEMKDIVLESEISASAGIRVHGVGEWMASIVGNLISNAIKYGPKNSKVVVRTVFDGDFIETSVEDTGPGFTEQDRAMLFRKFSRLSAKPTAKEHSTGLGLYVVKKMCDRLGIEIRVEGNPGGGARFVIRVPV